MKPIGQFGVPIYVQLWQTKNACNDTRTCSKLIKLHMYGTKSLTTRIRVL